MSKITIKTNIIESILIIYAVAFMITTIYKHLSGMIDDNTFNIHLILSVNIAIYAYISVMYKQLTRIERVTTPKQPLDDWGDADLIEGVFTKEVCDALKTKEG